MKNFKKLIKEAHLGNPLNEDRFKKNKDSYIRITEPRFRKDPNSPNFLFGYINYDTGPGVSIALGKETMAGQIRRESSAEALRQMEIIAGKLKDNYDLEDLEITDLENGVVELFAVSDDFDGIDIRSELSMALLNEENEKYDDEDIVIYDGEEHIIMSRDGNMIYIRPLEDSAILGKKDVIKVPARALAYKSDLDKMYDEYKPKDEVNEENEKFDHIARAEYGKPFSLLSIDQKQEMLSYMNKAAEKKFETDFERRRKGDYSDDMEDGMTDYERRRMDEGFKVGDEVTYLGHPAVVTATQEYNDRDFVSVSYDKGNGKTKARNILATSGDVKAVKEDMNDPVLVKARAAQMAVEKEKVKQAELDKKYGSNFMDKLDAEIGLKTELQNLKDEREQLMIDMEQEAEPEGGEIADLYGMKLNRIDLRTAEIKSELDDLRMYESVDEGTCGYGEDGVIGDKPASPSMEEDLEVDVSLYSDDSSIFSRPKEKVKVNIPGDFNDNEGEIAVEKELKKQNKSFKSFKVKDIKELPEDINLNEAEIPLWLTDNREFEKAVIVSTSFNDFEKRVYGILGPKYFKLAKVENPGAMKDYYDSIVNMEEAIDLDIDDAHSGDAALDNAVARMGYNESLNKSLKEALNKRLGK